MGIVLGKPATEDVPAMRIGFGEFRGLLPGWKSYTSVLVDELGPKKRSELLRLFPQILEARGRVAQNELAGRLLSALSDESYAQMRLILDPKTGAAHHVVRLP
jgi:hypothetical protein